MLYKVSWSSAIIQNSNDRYGENLVACESNSTNVQSLVGNYYAEISAKDQRFTSLQEKEKKVFGEKYLM